MRGSVGGDCAKVVLGGKKRKATDEGQRSRGSCSGLLNGTDQARICGVSTPIVTSLCIGNESSGKAEGLQAGYEVFEDLYHCLHVNISTVEVGLR